MALNKAQRRARIKHRIRKTVEGTADRPRLAVYRSNKEIYAQLINDDNGATVAAVGSLKNAEAHKGTKIEQAAVVGRLIAEKAKEAGVENVIFDRGGFLYHGRVKALADAAREAGLKF